MKICGGRGQHPLQEGVELIFRGGPTIVLEGVEA